MSLRRNWRGWLGLLAGLGLSQLCLAEVSPLVQRPWFEARTLYFHTYSCGPTQQVAKLAARLEQFRIAYSLLAGTQAVASPPIVVMAFPSHAALEPFLPVYDGKPANLAAFFSRGSDENLIALSLSSAGADAPSLEAVFHEYAHLLLRHNQQFWPMWLKEGMADIYATFEVTGNHSVRIGQPLAVYLQLLQRQPLRPLGQLLTVTRDSPEYNERQHQGPFYAESWLLTHYLMLGDQAAHRAQFGQLTALLRQGQSSEQAFTNAFGTSLAVMQRELQAYLQRGRFAPLALSVSADLYAPQALATRPVAPVERCFRLGDQLLRLERLPEAEQYFHYAQGLAPASPLPYEGLGMLAAERQQQDLALRYLGEALQRGSTSFLAHYTYAREKFRTTARAGETYSRLPAAQAAEIQTELQTALKLMPDFGPAHHLLGLLELLQGEDLTQAEAHLQRAIQLEPENQAYLLTLAQAQMTRKDAEAARRTLETLRRPYVEAPLRATAEKLLNALPQRRAEGAQ